MFSSGCPCLLHGCGYIFILSSCIAHSSFLSTYINPNCLWSFRLSHPTIKPLILIYISIKVSLRLNDKNISAAIIFLHITWLTKVIERRSDRLACQQQHIENQHKYMSSLSRQHVTSCAASEKKDGARVIIILFWCDTHSLNSFHWRRVCIFILKNQIHEDR